VPRHIAKGQFNFSLDSPPIRPTREVLAAWSEFVAQQSSQPQGDPSRPARDLSIGIVGSSQKIMTPAEVALAQSEREYEQRQREIAQSAEQERIEKANQEMADRRAQAGGWFRLYWLSYPKEAFANMRGYGWARGYFFSPSSVYSDENADIVNRELNAHSFHLAFDPSGASWRCRQAVIDAAAKRAAQ
jgi:hypothetical protein